MEKPKYLAAARARLSLTPSARLRPSPRPPLQVLSADIDLLNPPAALEARKHKLKR